MSIGPGTKKEIISSPDSFKKDYRPGEFSETVFHERVDTALRELGYNGGDEQKCLHDRIARSVAQVAGKLNNGEEDILSPVDAMLYDGIMVLREEGDGRSISYVRRGGWILPNRVPDWKARMGIDDVSIETVPLVIFNNKDTLYEEQPIMHIGVKTIEVSPDASIFYPLSL